MKIFEILSQKERGLRYARNEKGLTLIEMIVVIALVGVFLATVGIMISKGRKASSEGDYSQKIGIVIDGLAEKKMYSKVLPADSANNNGWGAQADGVLFDYIPTELHADWKYDCAAGVVTVTTPAYDSNDNAKAALTKLKDTNICAAASVVNAVDNKKVDCVVVQFNGSAGCP